MNRFLFSSAARFRSWTNCSSSSDMVLNVSPVRRSRCGFHMNALREIAARNRPAGLRQHLQRAGDAPRRENTQSHAHKHRQPCQQASRALHLVDAAIRLFARLLHHDRPIQRGHRTVRSQHLDRFFAMRDGEFPGRRQLGFVPSPTKLRTMSKCFISCPVAYCGVAGRHQPSLAVHNVGHQARQTDLLQPADQVVHDRPPTRSSPENGRHT
jgi:hypothetical protein